MTMPGRGAAFYTVADAPHFLGLVALVNSLRRAGHSEPINVYDIGLADWQRDLLAAEATVVRAAPSKWVPVLRKLELPIERPADVVVLVDADVIVLRRIDAVLDAAAGGKIVAVEDPVGERFHPDWGTALGLGDVTPGPYINTGLVAAPRLGGLDALRVAAASHARADGEPSFFRGDGDPRDPFFYLDQDVLNAVLRSEANSLPVEVLPPTAAPHPPFRGLESPSGDPFRLAYADGVEPLALHHVGRKPWLHPTFESPFSRLLRELLYTPGLAIRLDPRHLPVRLRRGLLAAADRRRASVYAAVYSQRGRLGLRRRVARRSRAR